jgi:hypothetical protein
MITKYGSEYSLIYIPIAIAIIQKTIIEYLIAISNFSFLKLQS